MTERQSGNDEMTPAVYLDRARDWSDTLERREADRPGIKRTDARPIVARKIGVAPGTLERLRNGRLKAIATHVYERIRAALIGELQAEMRRLEHEIHIAKQAGLDPLDRDLQEATADLAAVKAALGVGGT